MKKTDLLKSLLPGLIPLLVFIVADEIWGSLIGMIVAVGVGIVEFLYIYLRQKRKDKFVMLDTLLIVAMGLISIWLENEIFFKLKPFIIGVILCAILGVSAFSGKNIMLLMSRRYLKNISFDQTAEKRMHSSLKIMFWVFFAHSLLVLYAAFYLSNKVWAFISGPLMFILIGVIFVLEFLKLRIKTRKTATDWTPIVDEKGKIIGKAPREAVHNGSKLLHPVVHLHIINANMMILLQKRSETKKIQPGKWDTAVGGHVDLGEDIPTALKREAQEELFIEDLKEIPFVSYIWESEIEKELVFSFIEFRDKVENFNKSEIDEIKFWSFSEIKNRIEEGIFTPNFIHEFNILQNNIKQIRDNLKKMQKR
ncbi:MAG: NUDIX domain-containing protein [Bacteroidales bacterium]|nr:NUDIX domain-containing protein [Bacteroidales bacterium]